MKVYTRGVISLETGEVLEGDFFEYDGPVAHAGGGGSNDSTTNTVAMPPAFQIPFIQRMLQEAEARYDAGPREFFPGQMTAPLNEKQMAGINAMFGAAQGQQATAQNAADALNFQLGPGADPRTNPYFQGVQESIVRNATKGLTEGALPAIGDQAILAGGYGGSRHGVAQGIATDEFSKNLADSLTAFGSDAYRAGQQTQSRALALAPSITGNLAIPGQTMFAAGSPLREYEQSLLGEQIARHDFEQGAADDALARYAALVGNPLGSATSVQVEGSRTNPWVQGLGGAITGGVLGSMVPGFGAGAGGAFLGPAGIAGAGLGALVGLFG